jgi:hypothetical protein
LYKYLMNKIIFFYVIFRPCINCVQWVVNFEEEKQIIFLRVLKDVLNFSAISIWGWKLWTV